MSQSAKPGQGPAPGARTALTLLLAINLFNYIDRQVLSAVLPKLELDASMFSPTDPWLKTKLGSLTTAFMLSYMFLSPIFGWLGDRGSRWLVVGGAVILWSLASGGSGLAPAFIVLLLTALLRGRRRGRIWPSRSVDAFRSLPRVASRQDHGLFLLGHSGRHAPWASSSAGKSLSTRPGAGALRLSA